MSKQQNTVGRLKAQERLRLEGGFSMLQLLVTVTVMAVAGGFAFMGITSARENMRLSGSARQFAALVERARIDAVRRHVSSAAPTKIEFVDTNTYRVTMDFDGSGTPTSRDFTFQDGVEMFSRAPAALTFDWRGRLTGCNSTFALKNIKGNQTTVDITSSGDVTVDSDIESPPTLSYTNVNTTVDVYSDAVVKGTTAAPTFASTNCAAVSIEPSGGSIGGTTGTTGGATGGSSPTCSLIVAPGGVSIKKNGGTTGSVSVTVATTGTVTASGPSNLQITPASQIVTTSGSTSFAVKSLNNTRGTFTVTFSSGCTTTDLVVAVTN